jgi:hypothetical protein
MTPIPQFRSITVKSAIYLVAAAALAAASSAQAAAPTVLPGTLTAGYTFQEYTNTATPVGAGLVDVDNVLYYIDEKTASSPFCPADACKSFLIFFDPSTPRTSVQATLQFSDPILATYGHGILGVFRLTATSVPYGADGYTYFPAVFTGPEDFGLESSDVVTVSGSQLTIDWTASDPGDHLRVLVAVPEAGTSAMLTSGLLAMAWMARRRARRPGDAAA